jgi:hypothetical protein
MRCCWDDALPPRRYGAAADQCGVLVDDDNRTSGSRPHGVPGIVGQDGARRRGCAERVLDLLVFRPSGGAEVAKRQRDPTLPDPTDRCWLNFECLADRCGDRCVADDPDLKSTHRRKLGMGDSLCLGNPGVELDAARSSHAKRPAINTVAPGAPFNRASSSCRAARRSRRLRTRHSQ